MNKRGITAVQSLVSELIKQTNPRDEWYVIYLNETIMVRIRRTVSGQTIDSQTCFANIHLESLRFFNAEEEIRSLIKDFDTLITESPLDYYSTTTGFND